MKLPELQRSLKSLANDVEVYSRRVRWLSNRAVFGEKPDVKPAPLTTVQQDVLDALASGARLELRVSKRGKVGDFVLVDRKSKRADIVTRRTVAVICRLDSNFRWRKPPKGDGA